MDKGALDIQLEETTKGGRYFVVMPNGEQARLTFVRAGEDHIIADHTFVTPTYRGRGIAESMVKRLIVDARAAGLKIAPLCWFIADEFKRHHPDWDDVLKR